MTDALVKHRQIWKQKKILRDIYTVWYQKIVDHLALLPGKTLELGSGSGNFQEFKPDIISSDIDPHPWLDLCLDALHLHFLKEELANIVMIDVLHHLVDPIAFFNEAYRVLKPGGRIVMVEPYPSPFSKIIYQLFHPEPFIFNTDYFNHQVLNKDKHPWESNQAIPYLLFFKSRDKFQNLFSTKFIINKIEKFSFILYPLSGGFENKQMIPSCLIASAQIFEKLLTPFKDLFAFRCFIVLEKK